MTKRVPYFLSWLENSAALPAGLDYTLLLSPFCRIQNILAAITAALSYWDSKMDYSLKSKNKDRLESNQELGKPKHSWTFLFSAPYLPFTSQSTTADSDMEIAFQSFSSVKANTFTFICVCEYARLDAPWQALQTLHQVLPGPLTLMQFLSCHNISTFHIVKIGIMINHQTKLKPKFRGERQVEIIS